MSAEEDLATALAFHQAGLWADAEGAYRKFLQAHPGFAEARINLGEVLRRMGRVDEAIVEFRVAIGRDPRNVRAFGNLGAALLDAGKLAEGAEATRRAIELDPRRAEGYANLGNYFRAVGDNDSAEKAYATAVRLRPEFALAHLQLAWVLLLKGDFERGWREYQWRLSASESPVRLRAYRQPVWNGQELGGRRILLYGEQGCGDRIQFVRYAELVARRGGKVLLTCRGDLMRLYRGLQAPVELVDPEGGEPEFEVHCSLGSLPGILGTELGTIPGECPYILADVELVARWRARIAETGAAGLKVGLVWSGDPRNNADRYRSIPVAMLGPLGNIPGVQFFSLQKGFAGGQTEIVYPFSLIDWTDDLGDFAETAALMANLDLVITVDTAAAHLAGAIDVPVWTLLPLAGDWRWMVKRADSPWYPTMRLFRQERLGDWAGVIENIGVELRKLTAECA